MYFSMELFLKSKTYLETFILMKTLIDYNDSLKK